MSVAYVQIHGGKYHRLPAGFQVTNENAWHESPVCCGRTVTPVNYFDESDACYLRPFLCQQCASKGVES